MTTHTIQGFLLGRDFDNVPIAVARSQLQIVVADDVTGFDIALNFVEDPQNIHVLLEYDDYYTALNDEPLTDLGSTGTVIYEVSLNEGADTAIILALDIPGRVQTHFFQLSGSGFPDLDNALLATPQAAAAFVDGLTAQRPSEGSGFTVGSFVPFRSISEVQTTENDLIEGPRDITRIFGGLGDDLIGGADGVTAMYGGPGDDTILTGIGHFDLIQGGSGQDVVRMPWSRDAILQFQIDAADTIVMTYSTQPGEGPFDMRATDVELLEFTDGTFFVADLLEGVTRLGTVSGDVLQGQMGHDLLNGLAGNDTLEGLNGRDTLIGGAGDDRLIGGTEESDLRDLLYGGDGDDYIDGGFGNDELRGDAGMDTLAGGFGADTIIGGTGHDVLTGASFSDLMFGGDGDDFVNGGFGSDRVNGGDGADRFYHLGIADHGNDWVQDYDATEGDVLLFGNANASRDQFQVNYTTTPSAGEDGVEEAFVIYIPTEQIIWALVDGAGQDEINLRLGAQIFDLTEVL